MFASKCGQNVGNCSFFTFTKKLFQWKSNFHYAASLLVKPFFSSVLFKITSIIFFTPLCNASKNVTTTS